jgi:hypothetical protein
MTQEQWRRLRAFFTAVLFPNGEPRELPLPPRDPPPEPRNEASDSTPRHAA